MLEITDPDYYFVLLDDNVIMNMMSPVDVDMEPQNDEERELDREAVSIRSFNHTVNPWYFWYRC